MNKIRAILLIVLAMTLILMPNPFGVMAQGQNPVCKQVPSDGNVVLAWHFTNLDSLTYPYKSQWTTKWSRINDKSTGTFSSTNTLGDTLITNVTLADTLIATSDTDKVHLNTNDTGRISLTSTYTYTDTKNTLHISYAFYTANTTNDSVRLIIRTGFEAGTMYINSDTVLIGGVAATTTETTKDLSLSSNGPEVQLVVEQIGTNYNDGTLDVYVWKESPQMINLRNSYLEQPLYGK